MRRVSLLLVLLLAACGPSQGDVTRALSAHYENTTEVGVETDVTDIRDGEIADFEGCDRVESSYVCDVSFQTPDGIMAAKVYMLRSDGAWSVVNVSVVEEVG